MFRIAILGGGPSALFLYQKLLQSDVRDFDIDIYEETDRIGCGMPYSARGALHEHITNVSGDEVPELPQSLSEWIQQQPDDKLREFGIVRNEFTVRKPVARLLFGEYLAAQFETLLRTGRRAGVQTKVHLDSKIVDVKHDSASNHMWVELENDKRVAYDAVIMCTGHHWPVSHEGNVPGYFDSPYPPSKLEGVFDHAIAIRGSSLTAYDAIRTLARQHGEFVQIGPGKLSYKRREEFSNFSIVMHSTHGLLPAVRFHLDDVELEEKLLFSDEEIAGILRANDGFVPLDLIFERKFKDTFRNKDPEFHAHVKDIMLEDFAADVMRKRGQSDPFALLKAECKEARRSIAGHYSIYWKEVIGALSFILNFPAKHMSAEDTLRLHHVLQPLISVIIAYAPQRSCEELMALHEAGCLTLVNVGAQSRVECCEAGTVYHHTDKDGAKNSRYFQTFIDCIGQPHLPMKKFPFKSLLASNSVKNAFVHFKSDDEGRRLANNGRDDVAHQNGRYRLNLSGIAVDDNFQTVTDEQGPSSPFFIMAVPYISGHNPDYSGLDFCNEAAARIVARIDKLTMKQADNEPI